MPVIIVYILLDIFFFSDFLMPSPHTKPEVIPPIKIAVTPNESHVDAWRIGVEIYAITNKRHAKQSG